MNKRQQKFGEEVKKRNPGREWKLMGMETGRAPRETR